MKLDLVKPGLMALILYLGVCSMLSGQQATAPDGPPPPIVEITSIPTAGAGNATKLRTIKGRVTGAKPGQQIVIYARADTMWWVQPLLEHPFTKIGADSKWRNVTHPGVEYAALLVGPDFHTSLTSSSLPTAGVFASAIVAGSPDYWQKWWFPVACCLTGVLGIFVFHYLRLHRLTHGLNVRFEERLAERTRVAQELHDTLLQGVLSASMQLHVAVDRLPEDSPALPGLRRVLELMGQVVDEGRNTLQGLRSTGRDSSDLEQAFARIGNELAPGGNVSFRLLVDGSAKPLQGIIRDEVYSIGREALVNAFRHSGASKVELELEYGAEGLNVSIRDNGRGIDPVVLQSGREGHWGLSGMRERAERIGAKLKLWSRAQGGTEVALSIPSRIAFESDGSGGTSSWFARLYGFKAAGVYTSAKGK